MKKNNAAHKNKGQITALKKIRNNWGGVKPYTRVKQSVKLYNRKKEKRNAEE